MPDSTRDGLSRPQWEWLRAEAARWRADGLISDAQAQAILARYPEPAEPGRGRTTAVISLLGAILFGLGAILLIAHNWWQIPTSLKLFGILAAIAAAQATGYWLWQVRGSHPLVGHSLVLLGCLFYGAGIWLVAQMFHLQVHWPNGVLFWALGSLPVAWALDSRPTLALSALLLALWSAFEQTAFEQVSWFYLPLAAALVAPLAYRLKAPETIWLSLFGFTWWFGANGLRWVETAGSAAPLLFFVSLGLCGSALVSTGLWHQMRPVWHRLAAPYLLWGICLAMGAAYALTIRMGHWDPGRDLTPSWQIWTVNGLLGAVVLILAGMALRAGPAGRAEGPLPAAGVAAFAAGLFTGLVPWEPVRALCTNLLLFGGALGLVAWGFRQQAAALVNLGLLAVALQIITRYFDLFYSLLNRSLFFMLGGALLLGGGYVLERWRRQMLKGGIPHAG